MPYGACRELLMQLNGNHKTQILENRSPLRIVILTGLMPNYWK